MYLAFPADPEHFREMVRSLHVLGVLGFNVTVPYKKRIMRYCDSLSSDAHMVEAVNTVKLERDGTWSGHNTDIYGFLKNLSSAFPGFSLKGKRVLMLGAGGAASSALYGLLKQGASHVVIMNRTQEKAVRLGSRILHNMNVGSGKKGLKRKVSVIPLEKQLLKGDPDFDLVVNCTSWGLKKEKKSLLDLSCAPKGLLVYDMIYNPSETALLHEAKIKRLKHSNGKGMLLFQAKKSFHIWTQCFPK